MSKWTEKIREKEGRKGLIPWLSVSVQKWILVGIICIGITTIVISIGSDSLFPLGLILVLVTAFTIYISFKTSWLKKVDNANKPLRIAGGVVLGVVVIALVASLIIIVPLVFIFSAIIAGLFEAFNEWAESGFETESSETNDTGEDYFIKKEGGKEVVYKKGFIDEKVGDLHTNWDGSKETHSVFGPNIKVDKSDIFSTDRKGEVDGRNGVFNKGFSEKHPTFKPDKQKK